MSKSDYPSRQITNVVVSFESNLGDRFQHIEQSLRAIESPDAPGNLVIIDTSFLYERSVVDKPDSINGACLIQTSLKPTELSKLLNDIENAAGEPGGIVLDIIFYGTDAFDIQTDTHGSDYLVVPRPRACEQEYVLRALADMIPDFVHPLMKRTVRSLLDDVLPDHFLKKVIPVPCHPHSSTSHTEAPATLCHWSHPTTRTRPTLAGAKSQKTLLMAIINATPDSFSSDPSECNTLETRLDSAIRAVDDGADLVDIGGYTAVPGAAFVSPDEEIARVRPTIAGIRRANPKLPLSIDTFRPEVAEAAILAGANIINDIYAFTGPTCYPYPSEDVEENGGALAYMRKFKDLARRHAVPVVLMHSRPTAHLNRDYDEYMYAGADCAVIEGVRVELGRKVDEIVKGPGGVRRWLVIVDPGVYFSKTVEGALEVLRGTSELTADVTIGPDSLRRRNPLRGFPSLVATSRNSFLGLILKNAAAGRDTRPKERVSATAATLACAVQQGVKIVRVHDVRQAADVLCISDALWNC